jgi:putrescine transport system substrate-binding protein
MNPEVRRVFRLFVLPLLLCLIGPALAEDKVVNVFNWSDYIDPKVLDAFTKETGIKVVYDTYESNELLETRLLAGHTGYDVVVPSATFLQRQIAAGLLLPLDPGKLPNLKNVSPEIAARLAAYDPGNKYAVDYMWFTTGIAYNVAKAKERLGTTPITSWDLVFKPELLRKFADCGIYVLDSPEDMFTVALRYLKLDPDSKNPNDLKRAADLLTVMRKSVKKFSSADYINALANGDICLAVAWAGDSFQARNRAREARNGVDIAYVVPGEGTLMSLDSVAIPRDAPHPDEAYRFIDFLLRPENAARNTQITNFANPIPASKPLIDKDITGNPSIYPSDATMKTLFTVTPYDGPVQKFVTREWTRIKTGR